MTFRGRLAPPDDDDSVAVDPSDDVDDRADVDRACRPPTKYKQETSRDVQTHRTS